MAEIKLNIYKQGSKSEVEKTYCVESYDLMYGTLEDVLDVIDIEKAGNKLDLAKMIISRFQQLKPIIKDVFPELTDEELKRVKVPELIPMFTGIINAITESMGILNQGN